MKLGDVRRLQATIFIIWPNVIVGKCVFLDTSNLDAAGAQGSHTTFYLPFIWGNHRTNGRYHGASFGNHRIGKHFLCIKLVVFLAGTPV